jgi:hypothetical protein
MLKNHVVYLIKITSILRKSYYGEKSTKIIRGGIVMKELSPREIEILRLASKLACFSFILGLLVPLFFNGATSVYISLFLGISSVIIFVLIVCYTAVSDLFGDSRKKSLLIGCAAAATPLFLLALSLSHDDSITICLTIAFVGLLIYVFTYKDKEEE